MEAIRKAGGASKAGLKSAKDKKRKAKKEKEDIPASSSPGDLLGDLSAALGRRRKAMSGNTKRGEDAPNTGGGSMMDKIAAMIPPPPPPGGGGGDSDDGGSDEGEGEW